MFDREKYKKRVIKKQSEEIKTVGYTTSSDNDWAKSLFMSKLPSGQYFFNILPPHDVELGYYEQNSVSQLEIDVEGKDGNVVRKNKNVFSGQVHSASGKCIVAEYINLAEKIIESEEIDATEKQKKLSYLKGDPYNPNRKDFSNINYGIIPKSTYPMYVHITGNGLSELGGDGVYRMFANYTIKDSLLAIQEANQDTHEPINNPVDVFTDPDEGITLSLTVDTTKKGSDRYNCVGRQRRMGVPDEAYEFWLKQAPLNDMYVDSYTTKDFNLAIEGLKNFDEKYGFGIFGMDDFLDICEKYSELYPEPKKKVDNEPNTTNDLVKNKMEAKNKLEEEDDLPFDNDLNDKVVRGSGASESVSKAESINAKLAALKANMR